MAKKFFVVTENHMVTYQFLVLAETEDQAKSAAELLNPDEDAFQIDDEYVDGEVEKFEGADPKTFSTYYERFDKDGNTFVQKMGN
jgi:hypothetical protein